MGSTHDTVGTICSSPPKTYKYYIVFVRKRIPNVFGCPMFSDGLDLAIVIGFCRDLDPFHFEERAIPMMRPVDFLRTCTSFVTT